MKNFLHDVCTVCKTLKLTKSYDCKTEFKGDGEAPYFVMHVKGDYTVKPIHIAIGAAVVAGTYIITSVVSTAKHKAYCKKH